MIASYGFCRTTIYKWLRAAKGKGRGLDALRSRKGTGRPAKLTKSQQRRVFRWINGKDPRQYGFDFGLWTRKVVAELISDKFAIELSLASVGKLLADVGLTPQKPLMRAYERDPEAIEAWKRNAVQGTTWGVKGETPVVEVPGKRQTISAASGYAPELNPDELVWSYVKRTGSTAIRRISSSVL